MQKQNFINWAKEIDATLIVSNEEGIIIEMNDKAKNVFAEDTDKLIGSKLLNCHPAWARPKVEKLMQEKKPSCYTTETKKGNNFVYHSPWFESGEYKGLVEMVIPIPKDLPNIIRN
jgi:transcriptional regulator with PAS, ATPase and Fis domain